MINNQGYYLLGADGVGKSTFLNIIQNEFRVPSNRKIVNIWIRSPKVLSKPLMLYCRLVGLTKYKYIDGIRYGEHLFYKSTMISFLFPYLQLLDFRIKWFFVKRRISGSDLLLIDRFSIDTLVDLMVDTGNMELYKSWVGKSFLKLIPKNIKMVMIEVSSENIRKRKKDTLFDPTLDRKIESYNVLKEVLKIETIDNNQEFNNVKKKIINIVLDDF